MTSRPVFLVNKYRNSKEPSAFKLKAKWLRGGGGRWRIWLTHCATSRKVASPITDGVTGIFHWLNPSGRTMVLESTQPLTEISTSGYWGKESRRVALTTLPSSCADCLEILGDSTCWTPTGMSTPATGQALYLYPGNGGSCLPQNDDTHLLNLKSLRNWYIWQCVRVCVLMSYVWCTESTSNIHAPVFAALSLRN
jgi:hypothetical protein